MELDAQVVVEEDVEMLAVQGELAVDQDVEEVVILEEDQAVEEGVDVEEEEDVEEGVEEVDAGEINY